MLIKNEIRSSKTHIFAKNYNKFENISVVYKNEKSSSRSVILNIVFVFEKTGSVAPMPPKRNKQSKKKIRGQKSA